MRLIFGLLGTVGYLAVIWLLGLVVGFNELDGRLDHIASRILHKPDAFEHRPGLSKGTESDLNESDDVPLK
jgi:hypothetical protein